MTLKYREAFHAALANCRLQAMQRIDLFPYFISGGSFDELLEREQRTLAAHLGEVAATKATLHIERPPVSPDSRDVRASINVFTDDELDRLIQATVERARADLNWRRNRTPSFPSAR